MKRETVKSKHEQQRIVAYLDDLYPDGHLQQAKISALQEKEVKQFGDALRRTRRLALEAWDNMIG